MLFRLIFAGLVLCSTAGMAQIAGGSGLNSFVNTANGLPLKARTDDVTGNPFLYEDYRNAEITTVAGARFSNVMVKVNLNNGDVQYFDKNNIELIATVPIKQLRFLTPNTSTGTYAETIIAGYPNAINEPNAKISERLDSGKVLLYKVYTVGVKEEKRYGDAPLKKYEKKEFLALLGADQKLIAITKGKDDILAAMADKKDAVQKYIDEKKLKLKKEGEIVEVVKYYNSLP